MQFPDEAQLTNESDVEQKVVMPLLVTPLPDGLGIQSSKIVTKFNIRRFQIGKGAETKLYFPDYLIVESGIPLLVIEAKKPGEDLIEAFREARLYAAELNSIHPTNRNPLKKVIATDGIRLVAGYYDQSTPILTATYDKLGTYSVELAELQDFCAGPTLLAEFEGISKEIRPEKYFKPRRMLGGLALQHEEIGHNTFGATVAAEFSHIFNPDTLEDRKRIAIEGYISSRRRERYIDPIDRVIRAARPPSEVNARAIEDSASPKEIINVLRSGRSLQQQVILIVGSVGVGKTTFVDHLQYVALPKETINNTLWIRINMNHAPVSQNEIYDWLRREIIDGCRSNYPDVDFDTLEACRLLYSVEINRFKKKYAALLSQEKLDEELFKLLKELEKDLQATVLAHLRYCASERGLLPIIVLDNCDKRNRDEQLLLFEVAQWVRQEFRSLVILPLREETYDNYRDQPPLDTAQKDLVFRIEPPQFQNVLVSRIQLALNTIKASGEKTSRFELPNGFHVDYPSTDKAYFLKSILNSILYYDKQVRRMIIGLSGRSIRRALEIFNEFCTSGHFGDDQIFRITQSKGEYIPPLHVIMRVLLRGNRRFYDTDHAYVKNIIAVNIKDDRPSYLSRLLILRWLKSRFQEKGPTSFKGYFPISAIASDLDKYGVTSDVVLREVEYLAKGSCVITEDFRDTGLTMEHNVRLAPAGFVHLELLGSVDVLAAFAEDTWFEHSVVAESVRNRIVSLNEHYQPGTAVANAIAVLNQISKARDLQATYVEATLAKSEFNDLSDLSMSLEAVKKLEKNVPPLALAGITERFPVNSVHEGTIVKILPFGFIVELDTNVCGLLHESRMGTLKIKKQQSMGAKVNVKIERIDPKRGKIELSLSDWIAAAEKFTGNSIHRGRIVKKLQFGVLVELDTGITGLLHVSKMDDVTQKDFLSVGDEIEVKILAVKPTLNRIELSGPHWSA